MPEPKAQLVDPQGPIDVPGISATGIVTATGGFVGAVQGTATGLANTTTNLNVGVVTSTGFVGDVTGTASSVTKGVNLSLGIVTATSFAGDVFGNAAGLSTTTAGLKLGIVTATSFAGNFTGIGSGITGTPNIQAGIMTATSFLGNFTGLASGLTGTPNLMVGILTGTAYSGDGSTLTGIAATNWITNNVTANSSTTTVNLSLGNVVKFTQSADTTVSFANTGTSNIVTFIRIKDTNATERTLTWPSSIKWDGGSAPTLVPINVGGEEYNQIILLTRDEGVTWYGWESGSINRKTGQLYIWGKNNYGQLGQNSTTNYSSPVQIPGGWNELITGNDSQSGVAGTKNDGSLWSWGDNGQGELGDNTTVRKSSPVQIPGTTWWASDDKNQDGTAINGGWGIKRIIKSDGTLWQWGYNGYGILATGDTVSHSSPVQVPGTTWKAISGNSICCCATKTDGTLWCWGHNEFGALGTSNLTDYNSPRQVPGTTWDRPVLGAGQFSNGAFKTDGTLWTWGRNETGMLGLNNQTNYSSPKQIPGTTWRSCCMAAAQSGMIATKTDGTLWTWGTSGAGQLGLNDGSQYSSPKQVPGSWSDQVYMQGYVSMAIKTDGTLWSWGQGTNGRLGINDTTSYSSPKQIGSNTNWIRVGLGGDNWSGAIAEI